MQATDARVSSIKAHHRRAISLSIVAFVALLASQGEATAAQPCRPVFFHGKKVRVAVTGVGCSLGRDVTAHYFELLDEDPENVTPEARINGFKCVSGLANTQLFCSRGGQRVFASLRPEDHPGTWDHPRPAPGGLQLTPPEASRYMRRALGKRPALSFGEAIAQGDSAEEVSWQLGHKNSTVTRTVYVQEIASAERKARRRAKMQERYGDMLEGARQDSQTTATE